MGVRRHRTRADRPNRSRHRRGRPGAHSHAALGFRHRATAICVELCENHGKAHAFVLNHAPAGAKVSKLTRSSIKFLQKNGSTVIDAPLTYQEAYMAAATVGKSAPEVERGDDAHKEIEALWAVVKKLLVGKVS
jgi:hypothetical protein